MDQVTAIAPAGDTIISRTTLYAVIVGISVDLTPAISPAEGAKRSATKEGLIAGADE